MPRLSRALLSLPAALVCLGMVGCGGQRGEVVLYTQAHVSEEKLAADEKALKAERGVIKVITRHDAANTVALELIVDERLSEPGKTKARELGYKSTRD